MKPPIAHLIRPGLLIASLLILTTCSNKQPSFQAPLLKNIGNYGVTVTTGSKYAPDFFQPGDNYGQWI